MLRLVLEVTAQRLGFLRLQVDGAAILNRDSENRPTSFILPVGTAGMRANDKASIGANGGSSADDREFPSGALFRMSSPALDRRVFYPRRHIVQRRSSIRMPCSSSFQVIGAETQARGWDVPNRPKRACDPRHFDCNPLATVWPCRLSMRYSAVMRSGRSLARVMAIWLGPGPTLPFASAHAGSAINVAAARSGGLEEGGRFSDRGGMGPGGGLDDLRPGRAFNGSRSKCNNRVDRHRRSERNRVEIDAARLITIEATPSADDGEIDDVTDACSMSQVSIQAGRGVGARFKRKRAGNAVGVNVS